MVLQMDASLAAVSTRELQLRRWGSGMTGMEKFLEVSKNPACSFVAVWMVRPPALAAVRHAVPVCSGVELRRLSGSVAGMHSL